MKAFILTEGGRSTGFGHVTRCIALCQAFEERGIAPEFIARGDESIEPLLNGRRLRFLNWIEEKETALSIIEEADIIVIDSYMANTATYKEMSEAVKTAVYIDDNKRIDYPKGIVVNGSINADEMNYPERDGIVYLLGPLYLSLRREFWNIPEKEICEKVESIMVTFGGDDARNMAPKVLKVLTDFWPDAVKQVIIGRGYQNIDEIKKLGDSKTRLIFYPDAEGMKKIMLGADIAITAGGQTLYELARVGVPSIAVAIAENQFNNIRGWQKAGFIEYAGWCEDPSINENIRIFLNKLKDTALRKDISQIGRKLVDGKGSISVVNAVLTRMKQ